MEREQTYKTYQDTAELLAIKFPYSHHLLSRFERACRKIALAGRGWGRFIMDGKGLKGGQIVVKYTDLQYRDFEEEEGDEQGKAPG
jgi:hypothetical protein